MNIKKINSSYLGQLYNLGQEDFKNEFWFTKSFLKESIKRKGVYYGVFDGKKLIGAIFVDAGIDRPKAWIFFFYVSKKYRNQGLGHKLLAQAEKDLPKDYYKLFVDFEESDRLAINFYKKHGFKKAGKVKDWFGRGTYGLIYAKTIV